LRANRFLRLKHKVVVFSKFCTKSFDFMLTTPLRSTRGQAVAGRVISDEKSIWHVTPKQKRAKNIIAHCDKVAQHTRPRLRLWLSIHRCLTGSLLGWCRRGWGSEGGEVALPWTT
jgi:hypothetical protein